MRALLDINVLLALLDEDHIDHRRARSWLEREIVLGWASCAVTQNGFVRVMSQPNYPKSVAPATAMALLRRATATEHHEFWHSSISLLDSTHVVSDRVHGPRQVTDTYLLALATERRGRFVTFDSRIAVSAARRATAQNLLVL